ncbi:putative tRNA (uracil-O(2)-)-methyltransferase [Saccoglossus kowalevskii]|uniref:tRNA (uracil-O(2)-)-methyltransferase n=1 Tax=Saccoglossus kowalevskii TaxID=10224 RepID=A0ABM0MSK5_SACKO|nr:PREDICTED: probable tRNA (uracil-O(2)-)-methyltransferase-like [Saccoglossus kowalevskii]
MEGLLLTDDQWVDRGVLECKAEKAGFWKAIELWLQKPHVVNRRLSGAVLFLRMDLPPESVLALIRQHSELLCREDFSTKSLKDHTGFESNAVGSSPGAADDEDTVGCHGNIVTFCIRKILPKQLDRNKSVNECVVLDKFHGYATFLTYPNNNEHKDGRDCPIMSAYRIGFQQNESRINLQTPAVSDVLSHPSDGVTNPHLDWLLSFLLPKIVKWSAESDSQQSVQYKSLVPIDNYTVLYQKLKQKYGAKMVEIWPENTDPLKFVYEDIAIATYLLLLWEAEREEKALVEKQTFIDLGCGNGLLVYILVSEGHAGKGIDVHKRKIWDLFGDDIDLQEVTITPSDKALFPDTDWIIGNHSDELTPWIPVIAARSSYTTRYFVLPCCFYDFNCKFRRKNSKIPQYLTYLEYVMHIGEVCGFDVQEDRMRIPSTKRVCQVGSSRIYPVEEHIDRETLIQGFIDDRCQQNCLTKMVSSGGTEVTEHAQYDHSASDGDHSLDTQSATPAWVHHFEPRAQTEAVRNCSKVDYFLRKHITKTIGDVLISKGSDNDYIDIEYANGSGKQWNTGGKIPLPEVAKLFDSNILKQLKNECGGLQTLLRNSHQVFQVYGGEVRLRDWSKIGPIRKGTASSNQVPDASSPTRKLLGKSHDASQLRKTKLCWFHSNHPDGCPRMAMDCTFAHGEEEMKQRPTFQK